MNQSLDPSRTVPKMRQGWEQLAILYTYWSGSIEQDPISGSIPNCPKDEERVGTVSYPVYLLVWEYWAVTNLWIHPELSQKWGKGGHSYLHAFLLYLSGEYWSGQDPISGSIPNCPKYETRVGTATYPVYLLIWEYWAGPNLWIHPKLSPSGGKGGQQAGKTTYPGAQDLKGQEAGTVEPTS